MHTANIEIRECVKWSLKNNRKSLTFRPKKWSWSLTGWSFTRDFNCKTLTRKVLVFWIDGRLLALGQQNVFPKLAQFTLLAGESLILWEIDDRLREVVTHGCWTVNHEEF